jgi:hypothetical protein
MGKRFISLAIILLWTISLKAQNKMMVKPNIIIIMADDLGYSDIGCFGGEISTPNLDRLSKVGLRMTNFYNNARCSPTRASDTFEKPTIKTKTWMSSFFIFFIL